MDQQPHQAKVSKAPSQQQQSEWSLSSLQELKGINLNELKEQSGKEQEFLQKDNQHKQNQHKTQSHKYPPMQQITVSSMLHEVGKVLQKVEELIIVEANNCVNLVDLDNWLFNSDRECMGFVIDIFGRVEHPYYAIKLLHNVESKLENSESIVGKPLFSADGCKTLTEDDINSIKEKSSMYQQLDEGNSEAESEHEQQQQLKSAVYPSKRHPKRKDSFKQQQSYRDRTREKRRPNNKIQFEEKRRRQNFDYGGQIRDRQHDQIYLQNMYNMYHAQVMQMYKGAQTGMQFTNPTIFPPFHPQ